MQKQVSDPNDDRGDAVTTSVGNRRNSKLSTKDAPSTLAPEIRAEIEAVVKRLYVDPTAESFSIEAFCARYGVGRQLAYDEINAGRLVVKKAGRHTLIHRADAERWLERLPGFKPAASGKAAPGEPARQ